MLIPGDTFFNMLFLLLNLLLFLWPTYLIIDFIRDTLRHRKQMREIKELDEFHRFIVETIDNKSIDPNVKDEMSKFLLDKLREIDTTSIETVIKLDTIGIKSELYKRWGRHIPGYTEDNRDKRLKELGI
jgi:hypothetical protein